MKPSTLCILYGRVSTDMQEHSIAAQETRSEQYAAMRGLTVHDRIADPSVSGRTPFQEREGGARVLAAVRDGRVGHLVVAKLDRLGRNAKDVLDVVEECARSGVVVHFTDMNGDAISTGGPMGKLFLTFLAGFAEFEVEMIRWRTSEVMADMRRRNLVTGHIPYGQREIIGEGGARMVESNPDEQKVIDRIVAMHTAGMTLKAIARQLNREGVPTRSPAGRAVNVRGTLTVTTGEWNFGTVKRILDRALPKSVSSQR